MISLPLTAAEQRSLMDALVDSHEMRVEVRVLDRNEKEITSLTGEDSRLVGGSIQVDAGADVTRSLSLTLFDPKRKLHFDANSPAKGALFADRFIAVEYHVFVPDLDRWVEIPVFWGPLTHFERSGAEIEVEAQGKESLALAPSFATLPYTIGKGTRVDSAIRSVMSRIGERRFTIPKIGQRLSKARVVLPDSEPWKVIVGGDGAGLMVRGKRGEWARNKKKKRRANPADVETTVGLLSYAAASYGAFYDGRGRLTVRRKNQKSVHTFREGVDVIDTPQLSYDIEEFRNTVVVNGGTPKKSKTPIRIRTSLAAAHPLSPAALARNGERRYLTEFVDAPNEKTKASCLAFARRILAQRSSEGVDASFNVLPIPMLEEGDVVTLKTDEYSITFPLRSFTIPLTADSPMSIGIMRQVRVQRRSRW